jgi:hypothetical protein
MYHTKNLTDKKEMKKALLLALVALAFECRSQTEFTKVIPVDSTKDNFSRARLWVASAFKSAQNVIQYESADAILCKGNIPIDRTGSGMSGTIHRTHAGHVNFSMEIGLKPDRVRIKIYDLVHEAEHSGGSIDNERPICGGMTMTVKTWNSIKEQAVEKVNALIASFENAMVKTAEDW